jgi:phosphoglycerate dehydrogenase-like enzyme
MLTKLCHFVGKPIIHSRVLRLTSTAITLKHNQSCRSLSSLLDPTSLRYWKQPNATTPTGSTLFEEDKPIIREAKIVSLSDPDDDANSALHKRELPIGARLLQIGTKFDDFDMEALKREEPNVIFCSHPLARIPLGQLLEALPTVEWVHSRSAGIDFVTSPALSKSKVIMTNARGQFSSTLAEYTLLACSYFAKDLPRLLSQQRSYKWEKYNVSELRGATLGIVGYGDIGRACAKLAKIYGMRVVALRRNPQLAWNDPLCDKVLPSTTESLQELVSESDYILVSAPLTDETRGLMGRDQFQQTKRGAVFINVGRGPVVDEHALLEALQNGTLKGAALDVFTEEPLPQDSPLWALDNVLLSPHNMVRTKRKPFTFSLFLCIRLCLHVYASNSNLTIHGFPSGSNGNLYA